tara:strand:- start:10854 stop:11138 length:285 start_codon:yes stop_codon:yes gene_type:complete
LHGCIYKVLWDLDRSKEYSGDSRQLDAATLRKDHPHTQLLGELYLLEKLTDRGWRYLNEVLLFNSAKFISGHLSLTGLQKLIALLKSRDDHDGE